MHKKQVAMRLQACGRLYFVFLLVALKAQSAIATYEESGDCKVECTDVHQLQSMIQVMVINGKTKRLRSPPPRSVSAQLLYI